MAVFKISPALKGLTKGKLLIEVDCATVADGLNRLNEDYPGFAAQIISQPGVIKRYVSIFKGKDDIRLLQGLKTAVVKDSTITIMIASAGG
jgi:molybdopterin synthase sulfur carrier subunit